jgi:hypothetical protein
VDAWTATLKGLAGIPCCIMLTAMLWMHHGSIMARRASKYGMLMVVVWTDRNTGRAGRYCMLHHDHRYALPWRHHGSIKARQASKYGMLMVVVWTH